MSLGGGLVYKICDAFRNFFPAMYIASILLLEDFWQMIQYRTHAHNLHTLFLSSPILVREKKKSTAGSTLDKLLAGVSSVRRLGAGWDGKTISWG